ncbi:MAG: RagB/SusD family nutrient uptake outer membrane protein, partial [Bacteroidota bacterium]
NHRYWDLRRWRTAVTKLSRDFTGLGFKLDYETGKYKVSLIEKFDGEIRSPVFYEYNYYLPITLDRTGKNSKLVENPGYE